MKLSVGITWGVILFFQFAIPGHSHADEVWTKSKLSKEIKAELKKWQSSPKEYLQKLPPKFDQAGARISSKSKFTKKEIRTKSYIDQKAKTGPEYSRATSDGGRSEGRESISRFIPNTRLYEKISELDEKKLQSGKVDVQPWSDDYWAIYSGILGKRYGDPSFSRSSDWKKNFEYSEKYKASDIFASQDQREINRLSPSEKYDLLTGQTQTTMTDSMWNEGKLYYDRYGKVESWMGICHGWAPAAFMLPRPENAVEVMAADDRTKITFYPSDIKALATLLWAKVNTSTRGLGGRCNDKEPEKDENGRIIAENCFDVNPGTWHKALVNLVGLKKKSFVLDATYDYEVWNQPILSYEYHYFNPKTKEEVETLAEATVKVEDFVDDVLGKYRARKAVEVVGIGMRLTYMVETAPTQRRTDSAAQDAKQTALYLYDLELDKDGEIIGGEWYSNAHPDFLWKPVENQPALTYEDLFLLQDRNWTGKSALENEWKNLAVRAAERGEPLAKIVTSLIELSRK